MKTTFLSRFTPSMMKQEDLEAIFVQREALARRMVELIRDSALTPSKHYTLLIGPRGIGKSHLPLSMFALAMGGHIRVGMEDNIYYNRGELVKKNSQFVERIARIAEEYGREIATPSETRNILCLPKRI